MQAGASLERIRVEQATAGDAGEVLTVQRAAYVVEAQLYGDPTLPPLQESLEDVRRALTEPSVGFVAWWDSRLIGSVRLQVAGPTAEVSRLAVAPDMQGHGVASALLQAVEQACPEGVEQLELFTGHHSVRNLRLYERMGYREATRQVTAPHITEVHLAKRLHVSSREIDS